MRVKATLIGAVVVLFGATAAGAQKPWFSPSAVMGVPGGAPPGWSTNFKLPIEPIVIIRDEGGILHEHRARYASYRHAGAMVWIRGGCYSACTLITAYLDKDKLCIEPGAFLAFHLAHRNGVPALDATEEMYESYPADIRVWIDRQGGWRKLQLATFWTLYDHELWAMGYPRCD